MKAKYFLLPAILFLASCEKEKEDDPEQPFQAVNTSVYISNEGNFLSGNSSISYYNTSNGFINTNVYYSVNNTPLGDVCQSIGYSQGKLYLVINNSGKIEVCDQHSLVKQASITGFVSPRYFLEVVTGKAYVTDGFGNQIYIVNLSTNSISGNIPLNGFCEQMLPLNGKVYVTNTSSDYLFIVDTATNSINDSILISKGANSIRLDNVGKIWVLCSGHYQNTYNGALHRINPINAQVETNISFAQNEYPSRLCVNPTGDSLYFINNSVWKMSVNNTSLPTDTFVATTGNNFYGLGIDLAKNEVYVSDAIDFIQSGRIYRFAADGSPIDNFLAGIIPGDFFFNR